MKVYSLFCRRLYYSDCGKSPHISICSLSGEACSTIRFDEFGGCVTDISIDHKEEKIYWVNSDRRNIALADLDGNNIHSIGYHLLFFKLLKIKLQVPVLKVFFCFN